MRVVRRLVVSLLVFGVVAAAPAGENKELMKEVEAIYDAGKYMTVYVRQPDGSLKIKAETWNTDMNPMEMEAPGQE